MNKQWLLNHECFCLGTHSPEIRGFCWSFCPAKTLHLLYFYNKKTHIDFFVFHFKQLSFFPYECPGLCRHRPGHSLVKKIKLLEMKNENNYINRFTYYKNIANFEAFWRDKNFSKNLLFLGSDGSLTYK